MGVEDELKIDSLTSIEDVKNIFKDKSSISVQDIKKILKYITEQISRLLKKQSTHAILFFIASTVIATVGLKAVFILICGSLLNIIYICVKIVVSICGLTVSIGLGLGFGAHVYETLDRNRIEKIEKYDENEIEKFSSSRKFIYQNGVKTEELVDWDEIGKRDARSYLTFMSQAGYSQASTKTHLLRGQLRSIPDLPPMLDYNKINSGGAVDAMHQMWPNLPKQVNDQIGILANFIIRDFIVYWYGSVDTSVVYKDPATSEKDLKVDAAKKLESNVKKPNNKATKMEMAIMTSTMMYKLSPFVHTLTLSVSHLLGKLCTLSAENVNIFELILLKTVKALSKMLKFYRQARKNALIRKSSYLKTDLKQNTRSWNVVGQSFVNTMKTDDETCSENDSVDDDNVSFLSDVPEIAVVRELLISKRLHKAVTFGLDVHSLLYADPDGKKVPPSFEGNDERKEQFKNAKGLIAENIVLHERLFNSSLLEECELDYNRVLANRICRKLVRASDLSSPIVKHFLVEVFAGSLLSPIMNFFVPEYVNDWIVQGIGAYLKDQEESTTLSSSSSTSSSNDELLTFSGERSITESTSNDNNKSVSPTTNDEKKEEQISHAKAKKPDSDVLVEQQRKSTDKKINSVGQVEIQNDDNTTHINDLYVDNDDSYLVSEDVSFDASSETFACVDEVDSDLRGSNSFYLEGENLESDSGMSGLKSDDSFGNNSSDIFNGVEAAHNSESETTALDVKELIPLLTLAVVDIQNFLQIAGTAKRQDGQIDWENPTCRSAVCQLVLVIEAALQHGRKALRKDDKGALNSLLQEDVENSSSQSIDNFFFGGSLIDLLMEMSVNLLLFEKKIREQEQKMNLNNNEQLSEESGGGDSGEEEAEKNTLTNNIFKHESSNLRTVIVGWLQRGEIYNAMRVLESSPLVKSRYYRKNAFLNQNDIAFGFCTQLKLFDNVCMTVDTLTILEADGLLSSKNSIEERMDLDAFSPPMPSSPTGMSTKTFEDDKSTTNDNEKELNNNGNLNIIGSNVKANFLSNKNRLTRWVNNANSNLSSLNTSREMKSDDDKDEIIHHLNFHRNEVFVSELSMQNSKGKANWRKVWNGLVNTKMIDMVCNETSRYAHRELHYFSRLFYTSTFSLSAKDDPTNCDSDFQIVSRNVSTRRMIEVPDDDSSFLLRAQPRPIKPIRTHRDRSDQSNSFVDFVATYEEPVTHPATNRYSGGRYLRQCTLSYFPSNRTSFVTPVKNISTVTKSLGDKESQQMMVKLPESIQKDRIACQKVSLRTAAVSNVLMGHMMELTDFNSTPRSGKAVDFIYRLSLFERPLIQLSGKRFAIQDASSMGVHRADASSQELTDASLSVALILTGDNYYHLNAKKGISVSSSNEMNQLQSQTNHEDSKGNDETPTTNITEKDKKGDESKVISNDVSMEIPSKKMHKKKNDHVEIMMQIADLNGKNPDKIKHVRPSFLRAALLLTSTRQEAQRQCLLYSVKIGSARQATRARTEGLLQPTLALLNFANSNRSDKESNLLSNIKMISGHVSIETLQRRKILNPRFPTMVRGLTAKVEGWVNGVPYDADPKTTNQMILYKIRCLALVEIPSNHVLKASFDVRSGDTENEDDQNRRRVYKEEWVIMRPFKDFMAFHKHMKTQMSQVCAYGIQPNRFAVAGAGVFTPEALQQKKGFLLSLSQTAKIGALGLREKAIVRRQQLLNEYLSHIMSSTNLINRCAEINQFLCAHYPLILGNDLTFVDQYGRSEMRRVEVDAKLYPEIGESSHVLKKARDDRSQILSKKKPSIEKKDANEQEIAGNAVKGTEKQPQNDTLVLPEKKTTSKPHEGTVKKAKTKFDQKKLAQFALVRSRANRVKVSEVREVVFEFIRYLFDLDSATFFRSRLISGLRTMSIFVISAQDFSRILLNSHLKYLSGPYIGSLMKDLTDTLWPDGSWYTASPAMTPNEKSKLKDMAKNKLLEAFPDNFKTLLGVEVAEDGLNVLHEMLQNRLVLKSLGYMITDMLWLEIFPEMKDFLSGFEALDYDE